MERKITPCGRFAPSPTGSMHLGNVWTALLSWLYIRSQSGRMILRIEDLDPDRSKEEYTKQLIADLAWLGLDYDEGPGKEKPQHTYRQSERQAIYQFYLQKLQARGLLYPCFCSRQELHSLAGAPHVGEAYSIYRGTCRSLSEQERQARLASGRRPALRLQVFDETIRFTDGLYGAIAENVALSVGDFILRRSDGVFAYQFAVVIDDALMGISHVVRGADLLDSTARQIYLYRLLGFKTPEFIHVPLLCGDDGVRLSKRHNDVSLAELKQRGVTSEAIIGYLAYLAGWREQAEPISAVKLLPYFRLGTLPKGNIIIQEAEITAFLSAGFAKKQDCLRQRANTIESY
ncbi:MAG: tRNA glutamyl-Q(34) synthetase GluQRS [Sporomusaceae bacterium]|nr:tRNA glutamyl-Q(34) synthetase GluQRS [Sporomusaceae bacterium]